MKKTEEMAQMTPEMILTQDKKNFQIDYASIQSLEMSAPGLLGVGNIKIMTPGNEHKFQVQTKRLSCHMFHCFNRSCLEESL